MTDLSQSNTYPDRLRRLAKTLEQQAGDAKRRRLYGLADALKEAADSCDSWAGSFDDQGGELADDVPPPGYLRAPGAVDMFVRDTPANRAQLSRNVGAAFEEAG